MIEDMLRSIRNERKELKELQERLDRLRDKAMPGGLRINDVQVQTSVNPDSMADAVVNYVDVENNLRDTIFKLTFRIQIAELCIKKLQDSMERRVLRLYYLTGDEPVSMDEVAAQIPCAPSTAWLKRADGIKHADEILQKLRRVSESEL